MERSFLALFEKEKFSSYKKLNDAIEHFQDDNGVKYVISNSHGKQFLYCSKNKFSSFQEVEGYFRTFSKEKLDKLITGNKRRYLSLILGILELIWFSGHHYSLMSVKDAYKTNGLFETSNDQDKMFDYAMMVSTFVQMILVTPVGYFMDTQGLRVTKLLTVIVWFVGTLLMGFADRNKGWFLFLGCSLVAISSVTSLMCNQQISKMFPKYCGIVIALMSGAFDSSGIIGFIFAKCSEFTSLKTMYMSLGSCGLVLGLFNGMFLLTRRSSDMEMFSKSKNEVDNNTEIMFENDNDDVFKRINDSVQQRYPNFMSCIKSLPFILVCGWMVLVYLRFVYFLAGFSQAIDWAFKLEEIKNHLNVYFGAFLTSALIFAPITGVTIDYIRAYFRRKLPCGQLNDDKSYWMLLTGLAPALFSMGLFCTILNLLLFIKSEVIYMIALIIFVIIRSFLFSGCVAFILTAFPGRYFGFVNGLVNTVAGLFGSIQYGLRELSFIQANAFQTAACLLIFIPPIIIYYKMRKSAK